jgi:hypothetical protein
LLSFFGIIKALLKGAEISVGATVANIRWLPGFIAVLIIRYKLIAMFSWMSVNTESASGFARSIATYMFHPAFFVKNASFAFTIMLYRRLGVRFITDLL